MKKIPAPLPIFLHCGSRVKRRAGRSRTKTRAKSFVVSASAKLTPKRKMILETAMNSKLTPDQLKKLSDAFDKEGLKVEADLLRKRIDLQTAPQDQKDKWAAAFKKAMAAAFRLPRRRSISEITRALRLNPSASSPASRNICGAALPHFCRRSREAQNKSPPRGC